MVYCCRLRVDRPTGVCPYSRQCGSGYYVFVAAELDSVLLTPMGLVSTPSYVLAFVV